MDSLLAARLGMTHASAPASKPVASPVVGPGNHAPASTAAQGKSGPGADLLAAHAAHTKGDHHTAKKHALRAVNALHRMSATPAAPSDPVDAV